MPYDPERHGPVRIVGPGFHEKVWAVVRRVPPGLVTTYGDVAAALGRRGVARQVGYALAGIPADREDVPWHRVVNARGEVSARNGAGEQRRRLRAEGVVVNAAGRVEDFKELRCDMALIFDERSAGG